MYLPLKKSLPKISLGKVPKKPFTKWPPSPNVKSYNQCILSFQHAIKKLLSIPDVAGGKVSPRGEYKPLLFFTLLDYSGARINVLKNVHDLCAILLRFWEIERITHYAH